MKKVLLIVNSAQERSNVLSNEIHDILQGFGLAVYVLNRHQSGTVSIDADLAISLGGDGTVLFAARTVAPESIPLLPVNLGKIGFIAAVAPEKWQDVFQEWQAGSASLSYRLMLEVLVERAKKPVFQGVCLNDVVISTNSISMINLKLRTDDTELMSYRSDGLILATPTGSTAYSLSAGGPIVDPELDALTINPICPFGLANRPMLVPAERVVTVQIEHRQRAEVLLTLDGQIIEPLEPDDCLFVRKAPYKVQLIGSNRAAFYRAIHTKLLGV
ncbi:MAG: NAD(+)/NADH kinase [Spirochaetaceae bacterium]|nr:NAD(+)/NADH kinase [Spirochaetaceae bacterium]